MSESLVEIVQVGGRALVDPGSGHSISIISSLVLRQSTIVSWTRWIQTSYQRSDLVSLFRLFLN